MRLEQRPSRTYSGKELLHSLLKQPQPVVDPTALVVLEYLAQTVVDDVETTAQLGTIWERAATSLSRDNAWVYKAWFETKFCRGLYKEAKQVCILEFEVSSNGINGTDNSLTNNEK